MIVTHRRQTVITLVICLLLQSLSAYGCVQFNQDVADQTSHTSRVGASGHCHNAEASDSTPSQHQSSQEFSADHTSGSNCDHCNHGLCGKTTSVVTEPIVAKLSNQDMLVVRNQFLPLSASLEPPEQPPKSI